MKPRRPTFALLLQRALLALLLVAALFLQGVPLNVASAQMSAAMPAADAATPPCHDAGDTKEAPTPEKTKADPFGCCATFACGMMFQALPPDFLPDAPAIASTFARPTGRLLPDLPQPDAAWRPPALSL